LILTLIPVDAAGHHPFRVITLMANAIRVGEHLLSRMA
jgi:hypothetical protein